MRHVYDDCNHGNCRQEKRKEKDMNLSTNKNVNGELVDLDQACSITNLGRNHWNTSRTDINLSK